MNNYNKFDSIDSYTKNNSSAMKASKINYNKNYITKVLISAIVSFLIGNAFLFTYANFFIVPFLLILSKKMSKEFYLIAFSSMLGVLFYYSTKTYFFTYTSIVINPSILIKYYSAITLVCILRNFLYITKYNNKIAEPFFPAIISFMSGLILVIYYSFSPFHITLLLIETFLSVVFSKVLVQGINFITLNNIRLHNSVDDYEMFSIILFVFVIILSTNNFSLFGISISSALLLSVLFLVSSYLKSIVTFYSSFLLCFFYTVILEEYSINFIIITSIVFSVSALLKSKNKIIHSIVVLLLYMSIFILWDSLLHQITLDDYKILLLGVLIYLTIDIKKLDEISKKYIHFGSKEDYSKYNIYKLQEQLILSNNNFLASYRLAFESINKHLINCKLKETNKKNYDEVVNSLKYIMNEQFLFSLDALTNVSKVALDNISKHTENENKLLHLLEKNGFHILTVLLSDTSNGKTEIDFLINDYIDTPRNKNKLTRLVNINTKKHFYISKTMLVNNKTYKLTFNEVPTYSIEVNQKLISKNNDKISGDCFTILDNYRGLSTIAISDGMGSGIKANEISSTTLNVLDDLISAELDINRAIKILNNTNLIYNEEFFSTLDLISIDKHTGNANLYKFGSAPTYLYRKGRVRKIQTNNLPIGILNDIEINKKVIKLENEDILFMMTDGIFEANKNNIDKDLWLIELIEKCNKRQPQSMLNSIAKKAISYGNSGLPEDDMLLLIIKINKKVTYV